MEYVGMFVIILLIVWTIVAVKFMKKNAHNYGCNKNCGRDCSTCKKDTI